MKYFVICIFILATGSAQAAKIQKLSCRAVDQTAVEIVFSRAFDPLVPFTVYEFGAQIEIFGKRGLYGRADVRITPLKTTHDVDLRGDVADAVYLRLAPVVTQGQFAGTYVGQLFVNDLNVKAYFNFKNTGAMPGLSCDAH